MQHWRFIDSTYRPEHALTGGFDPVLVALSVGIASLAALSALAVVDRIQASRVRVARLGWLALGSGVLGSGIWAMHFTGMLAYSLPVPVSYSFSWTLISVAPALFGGWASLSILSRSAPGPGRIQLAGLMMALGIGAMHYAGMEAMQVDARMWYDPLRFVVSILVAHALATTALFVRFFIGPRLGSRWRSWLVSGSLIGVAISGMHYTAMAAVRFVPSDTHTPGQPWINPAALALLVAGIVALIAAVALVATVADRRIREAHGAATDHADRHRAVLTSLGEGSLTVDSAGRIETTNDSAEQLLGVPADGLLGRPIDEYLTVDARDGGSVRFGLGIGSLHSGPGAARRPDGRTIPIELRLYRFEMAGRAYTEILVHDVTERRALEQQLTQAQKLEAIGQLSAGIAHEINTPIQYVGDNTRFLKDAFQDLNQVIAPLVALKEQARRHPDLEAACDAADQAAAHADSQMLVGEIPLAIEQTLEGIERVARIVRAMKEFSHPATEKTPIDLNRAIASTVTVATNEWKYVADVETDLDPELPPVPCVPGEINQVILNLIVNAAHAIGDVGDQAGYRGAIRIITRHQDGHAVIRVSDTGTGIPESVRTRIFDPFFTTKDVGKGSGQGLSLAHTVIVRKHGGTITFESELGTGTTFEVRLPLAQVVEVAA